MQLRAMLQLGFAGLGFAGCRRAKTGHTALAATGETPTRKGLPFSGLTMTILKPLPADTLAVDQVG
jgi:hypothetical protein